GLEKGHRIEGPAADYLVQSARQVGEVLASSPNRDVPSRVKDNAVMRCHKVVVPGQWHVRIFAERVAVGVDELESVQVICPSPEPIQLNLAHFALGFER